MDIDDFDDDINFEDNVNEDIDKITIALLNEKVSKYIMIESRSRANRICIIMV